MTIDAPTPDQVVNSRSVRVEATFSCPDSTINWVKVNGYTAEENNGSIGWTLSDLRRGANQITVKVNFNWEATENYDYTVAETVRCFFWQDDQIKSQRDWDFKFENALQWTASYTNEGETLYRKGRWYYDECEDGVGWSYFAITQGNVTDYGDYKYRYQAEQDSLDWSVGSSDNGIRMLPDGAQHVRQWIDYRGLNCLAVERSTTYVCNDVGTSWAVGWSYRYTGTTEKTGTYRTKPIADRNQSIYVFEDVQPVAFWSRMQDSGFDFSGCMVDGQPLHLIDGEYYIYVNLPTDADYTPTLSARAKQ